MCSELRVAGEVAGVTPGRELHLNRVSEDGLLKADTSDNCRDNICPFARGLLIN